MPSAAAAGTGRCVAHTAAGALRRRVWGSGSAARLAVSLLLRVLSMQMGPSMLFIALEEDVRYYETNFPTASGISHTLAQLHKRNFAGKTI